MLLNRRLSLEELKLLESEFILFLSSQGIDAQKWQCINESDRDLANDYINQFSNFILEKTLRKIQYLEIHTSGKKASIQFQNDRMILAVIESNKPFEQLQADEKKQFDNINRSAGYKAYTSEQAYSAPRESVIFEYTEKGWQISNGKLFKNILAVIA
ncbi:MAG TPA: DUF6495 family protein [Saprospiraceae bacterium]|nr:DUF6495 family protein [Saprospiraceae bacterium]